ncbi:hypothetical protein JKF63_02907 [Porcisia hertigi]|uniref:WW domain-containing protein n=1 Tax=Porcisia hertigi TaxID=2761500 RepID=A0A836L4L9_9TRYP|nr:hypothetical protein JKF63_02907 [Porcisia hertigi]
MLPVAAPLEGQSQHSSTTNGFSRHRHKKSSTMTAVASSATNVSSSGAARGSAPFLVNNASSPDDGTPNPTGSSGALSPSIGCVRWCMNVALQSFRGEPWAVTLQPAAEDEMALSGSRHDSSADCTVPLPPLTPLHPALTTTNTAANSTCPQPPQAQGSPSGIQCESHSATSPGHTSLGPRMGCSMLRTGLQLTAVDYSNPQLQYPGGPVMDASIFGYDPLSEDSAALHQCVSAVNNPPVTYGTDDLLNRITNVEFIAEESTPLEITPVVATHYRLASSLEPMLNATLGPAITAVVDHCISSIVVVYGATQEMKQMGLIGTPEACGLLPHGIRTIMERFLERREHQRSKAASANNAADPDGDRAAASAGGGGGNASPSAAHRAGGGVRPTSRYGDDTTSDSDHTEGVHSQSASSQGCSFVFPSIGSRHHRFVRMEATFIAFDSSSVVDLLDLSNKHVELVLKLAPPPTPSAFEEKTDDVNSPTNPSATTDSFVLNAQAMSVENTNDALSALDIGLENLSRALELVLLQSESGSSLLFSLTAFTDTCCSATMHVLCLAEDPAAQTWLASTVQARSQAIPLGEEQSWASIQNTPMPPPLHHHAATMLVPALCFGNMFTSVLICAYNSITALGRLNRDLTLAVAGYRMRTIPRVTMASSRRGPKKLPPSWEEYFTKDGRRYFIDTTTQTTTWEDPRLSSSHRSSRSGGSVGNSLSGSTPSGGSSRSHRNRGSQHRPSRIGLGPGDKDFLASRLQQEMHGGGVGLTASSDTTQRPGISGTSEEPLDIGIVVVDTMCRPRVLINPKSPQFSLQYREQEELLHAKQRELEKAAAQLRQRAESKAKASAVLAEAAKKAPQGANDAVKLATPKSSDVEQSMADSVKLVQTTAPLSSRLTPPSREAGLGDVDDEKVSTLCRSSSVNIEDFMVEGESVEDDDEAGASNQVLAPVAASRQTADLITSVTNANGVDRSPEQKGCNAEARFYADALQEQTASAAERKTSNGMPSTHTSATASPEVESVAVSGGSRGVASTPPERRSASESGDASHASTTTVAIPPEVQDLDSLVDEFTVFYRKTYQLQQRVIELESEMRRQKLSAHSSSVESAAALSDAGLPELVQNMLKAVEASPSAEVHALIAPILTTAEFNTSAADTASLVLSAFHEALRLAAQKPWARETAGSVSGQH